MNSKPNRQYHLQRISARDHGLSQRKHSRPYWLPASSYYVLTVAVVIAFFLLFGEFLHEAGEETPWISAGIGAFILMGCAVFIREVILRKARDRVISIEKRLDFNLKNVPPVAAHSNRNINKLSIEKNIEIINKIQLKSEAAKVLGRLSNGHFEVYEICNEYLRVNRIELENIGVGSPRLASLRRGKEIVQDIHRYHLLSWAQIESQSLTQKAKTLTNVSDRLEIAQNALSVLNTASEYYPDEVKLVESESALNEFIASIKISHWVEEAERSAFKGNYKKAISHYKDALYFLARENVQSIQKDSIAAKINSEIDILREKAESKKNVLISKRAKIIKVND